MTTKKLRSIKGRAARITRLDSCGNVVYGNSSLIVTQGFITVTIGEELEAGDEYTSKNAWGEFCVNDKDPDIMKWANVSIEFCEVDPDIMDIIGGATPQVVGSNTVGWTRGPHAPTGAFALEVWTKKAGQDACVGGTIEWGWFIVPFLKNGKLDGTLDIGNDVMSVSMTAEGYGAPSTWAKGPTGDNPSGLTAGFPTGEMYGGFVTTVQPPAPTVSVSPIFDKGTVLPGDVFASEPTVLAQDATNAGKLTALGYITDPTKTANWLTGEFMTIGTYKFNWTGAAWAAGVHA